MTQTTESRIDRILDLLQADPEPLLIMCRSPLVWRDRPNEPK